MTKDGENKQAANENKAALRYDEVLREIRHALVRRLERDTRTLADNRNTGQEPAYSSYAMTEKPALELLATLLQVDLQDQQTAILECMEGRTQKQAELQEQQKTILDRMEKASRSQGRWAIKIAIVSLLVACLAAYGSLSAYTVSAAALRSSSAWQAEQIPVLEQIRDRLPEKPDKGDGEKPSATPPAPLPPAP